MVFEPDFEAEEGDNNNDDNNNNGNIIIILLLFIFNLNKKTATVFLLVSLFVPLKWLNVYFPLFLFSAFLVK